MKMKDWKENLIRNIEGIPEDSDYAEIKANLGWSSIAGHSDVKVVFGTKVKSK